MQECFCGGKMRRPTKGEETDIINRLTSLVSATVSC
jgi:hypothetical protein